MGDSENFLLPARSCIPLPVSGMFQEIKSTCHTTSYEEEMKEKDLSIVDLSVSSILFLGGT